MTLLQELINCTIQVPVVTAKDSSSFDFINAYALEELDLLIKVWVLVGSCNVYQRVLTVKANSPAKSHPSRKHSSSAWLFDQTSPSLSCIEQQRRRPVDRSVQQMTSRLEWRVKPIAMTLSEPKRSLRCPSRLRQSPTRRWSARFSSETWPSVDWMDSLLESEYPGWTLLARKAYLKTQIDCKSSEDWLAVEHSPGGPVISPRRFMKLSLTSSSFMPQ